MRRVIAVPFSFFFFSSRRRHTRCLSDWSSDVCSSDLDKLLANWLFHGLVLDQETGVKDLYEVALEMERRTRDHFRKLAGDLPAGLEKDLCGELAAEEEEHVALLEGELEGLG